MSTPPRFGEFSPWTAVYWTSWLAYLVSVGYLVAFATTLQEAGVAVSVGVGAAHIVWMLVFTDKPRT